MLFKNVTKMLHMALIMRRNDCIAGHHVINDKNTCSYLVPALLSAILMLAACGSTQKREGMHVDITSFIGDKQSFRVGDELSFLISLNENAWLYMYYENAEGNVYQLMPSVLYTDNHASAGDFIAFPSLDAAFNLEISPPFGEEHVWLLASEKELTLPRYANHNLTEIEVSLADIKSDFEKLTHTNRLRTSEDVLTFTTKK